MSDAVGVASVVLISGIGEPIAGNEFKSADMLWRGREASNQALIEGMIL